MNNAKSACLPLTQEDVFVLRGKPMAKMIAPAQGKSDNKGEEWIYYKSNKEEHFIFKNGKLAEYLTSHLQV
jgi:hypothetical protein